MKKGIHIYKEGCFAGSLPKEIYFLVYYKFTVIFKIFHVGQLTLFLHSKKFFKKEGQETFNLFSFQMLFQVNEGKSGPTLYRTDMKYYTPAED